MRFYISISLYNSGQHRNIDTRLKARKHQIAVLVEDFSRLKKVVAEKTSTGLEISVQSC